MKIFFLLKLKKNPVSQWMCKIDPYGFFFHIMNHAIDTLKRPTLYRKLVLTLPNKNAYYFFRKLKYCRNTATLIDDDKSTID